MANEINPNLIPQEEEINTTTENVAEQTAEVKEDKKENTAKVEPLPEQKPFLMSPYERAILEEMERRATEDTALAEGLKSKDKSIGECFAFVSHRAKKLATDTCAMIEDSVVFAWAQFYYTQSKDIINLELKYTPKPTPTATTTAKTTNSKAGAKTTKKDTKTETTKSESKEQSATKTEQVKGGNGKVYTITELALF